MRTFAVRSLDPVDAPRSLELARRIGVHGVYVGNYLSATGGVGEEGELEGFFGESELVGLAYFGSRGNLILIESEPLDGEAVARAVYECRWSWRIVLGPPAAIDQLEQRERRPPLVRRRQLYYGVAPGEVDPALLRDDVRPAERRDQAALFEAALDLNEADLRVDPRRVHRQWLRESIRRRIRERRTLVIGSPGRPVAKLDIGSSGPLGVMVEGVYTFPQHRGQRLATGLVATVAARAALPGAIAPPLVCLHVAETNAPARRAYEHAGMAVLDSCALMLRS